MMAAAVAATRNRAWLWPAAGAFAALAHLSRNEGLILIVVVLLSALASDGLARARVLRAVGVALSYLTVMSPFYWHNLRHFGSLMPPASGAVPFIGTYENLFALSVPRSLSALLDGGFAHFLRLRITTLDQQIGTAFRSTDSIDAVLLIAFTGIGVVRSHAWAAEAPAAGRSRLARVRDCAVRLAGNRWFVPAGYAIATFLFYALVAPVVASTGAVGKGMVTILPVVVIAGLDGLARSRVRPAFVALVVGVLVAFPCLHLADATNSVIASNNGAGARYAAWMPWLAAESACLGRPVVVMTRDPWEFTQATGYRSVMIPNGPLDHILTTALRYHVTDIEPTTQRAALSKVSELLTRGVLRRSETLRNTGLYRLLETTRDARC
jgi:hypothetical protein